MTTYNGLSIFKRDADCYDVTSKGGRVAALRSEFTEDEKRVRTAVPGTWRVRWEEHGEDGRYVDPDPGVAALRFASVYEAFAFFCGQRLA